MGPSSQTSPRDDVAQKRWLLSQLDRLENGKIEDLVAQLRSTPATTADIADTLRIEAAYFNKNANRMRYPSFRRQGLFVGSGVIEAGWQNCDWPSQTIRHVLDRPGRQRHHCPSLQSTEWSFRDYWEARRA